MTEELIQSEIGTCYLPWFKQIFDEGKDDSTKPGEDLVLYLASGAADALSGRFFQAPEAPGRLKGQEDRILNNGLNVLRLKT